VCSTEGEGPCCFCGNPVYYPHNIDEFEEQVALMKNIEEDPELIQNYFKAVETKEKLINFDKGDIAKKNVYDGDTDWYELKNDVWQDDTIRKEALRQMIQQEDEEEYAEKNVLTGIDGLTGNFIETKINVDYIKHKKNLEELISRGDKITSKTVDVDTRIKDKEREVMDELHKSYAQKEAALAAVNKYRNPEAARKKVHHDDCYNDFQKAIDALKSVQVGLGDENFDKELFKLHPSATNCLSMWQPWASLVVYGFKRFEGRHWDSEYQGPLWIHAGSKQPTDEEIKAVEDQYRKLYDGVDMPPFPSTYPTSCLLGVVDLQIVVTQEDYRKYIPKKYTSESTSEHIFVMRNPRRLTTTVRLSGQRGVFQITDDVSESAMKNLKKVPSSWFPYYANNIPERVKAVVDDEKTEETVKEQKREATFSLVMDQESITIHKVKSPEEQLYLFMGAFEQAYAKHIKQEEKFFLAFDDTMQGYHHMLNLLTDLYEEAGAMKRELVTGLPKQIIVYSVKQKTNRFEIKEPIRAIFVFGKSVEFVVAGGKTATVKDNHCVYSPKYSVNMSFLRVLKSKKKGKMSEYPNKIQGDSVFVAFS